MKSFVITGLLLLEIVGSGQAVQAACQTPRAPKCKNWNPSPEQRQNMAKMLEQTIDCLRSNDPISICQDKIGKNDQAMDQVYCLEQRETKHNAKSIDEK